MAKGKKKYYVVWVGKNPGIYDSWKECQSQISGYPAAKYKAFPSLEEATEAFRNSFHSYYQSGNKKESRDYHNFSGEIIMDSICVDAACSGNPGILEYRGVRTRDRQVIFHQGPFKEGTNNIGEFLAIVHALALFHTSGQNNQIIYTDSRTAISWIRNRKVKTKLAKNVHNEVLFELIARAEKWLRENDWDHRILKWDTERWGEIPADFGRK